MVRLNYFNREHCHHCPLRKKSPLNKKGDFVYSGGTGWVALVEWSTVDRSTEYNIMAVVSLEHGCLLLRNVMVTLKTNRW